MQEYINIFGLTKEEINSRVASGLTNKNKKMIGKTIPKILISNFLSFFNIFLVALAVVLIIAKKYTSLAFIVIYGFNIGINIYQDLKAYFLIKKLRIISDPKVTVIREGHEEVINVEDIVIDDIVIYKTSNQIVADAIVVEGEIGVNESLLTGESLVVYKKKGDTIYSGTFIVNGKCASKVINVGKNNYVNKLEQSASKTKTQKSEISNTLTWLYRILSIIVICFGTAMVITKWNRLVTDFEGTIGEFAGSLIAMIPAGLYLLSSIALSVGVLNLGKKNALVQDFYSIEMLARCTTLCLDKTGTITDGTMEVTEIKNLNKIPDISVKSLLNSLVSGTGDDNASAKAIKNYCQNTEIKEIKNKLPFDSANKYSAVTIGATTYVLGALECLNVKNKETYNDINIYLYQGLRVLAFGKTKGFIEKGKVNGEVEVLAFVIIRDHIRDTAPETFAWFKNNGVKIRVISGDNVLTVSHIAKEAGIENADKYISLEGKSIQEVKSIAKDYYVFGRVTPEQKEAIVDALKESGEVVGMTGDGVNDILALRKADCSITVKEGSDAAKNVSQLVLLDSNFASLPSVVAEGRRVINNLQRTCSLFLTKTFYAIICTLIFMVLEWCQIGGGYPFEANYLYLWELTTIGLGSLLMALEPNVEKIEGKFFKNIIKMSVPGAVMMTLMVFYVYMLYALKIDVFTPEVAKSICALLFSTLPLSTLYVICYPFSEKRKWIFAIVVLLNLICLGIQVALSLTGTTNEPLKIFFTQLTAVNYVEAIIGLVIFSALYIGGYFIYWTIKGKRKDK